MDKLPVLRAAWINLQGHHLNLSDIAEAMFYDLVETVYNSEPKYFHRARLEVDAFIMGVMEADRADSADQEALLPPPLLLLTPPRTRKVKFRQEDRLQHVYQRLPEQRQAMFMPKAEFTALFNQAKKERAAQKLQARQLALRARHEKRAILSKNPEEFAAAAKAAVQRKQRLAQEKRKIQEETWAYWGVPAPVKRRTKNAGGSKAAQGGSKAAQGGA